MNTKSTKELSEVYGTSREVPLTYQERPQVDDRFILDIKRDKHIVLHGGSKQGKTCLRRKHLDEADYVLVQCTRDTTRSKLYELILKNANFKYEVSHSITTSGTNKITVNISAEGRLPLLKAGGKAEYEGTKENENSINYKQLDIDPEDPNDLVRVLTASGFKKLIVIEDFHYLDADVQKQFAFDLKVFHEASKKLVFIIIGVWLETNRLLLYNGDLNGRLTNINVDLWPDESLQKVIDNGKPLLNIQFSEDVESEIIRISQDNVGLLQELCYRLCEKHEVWRTQDKIKTIGTVEQVNELAKIIADDQAGRYSTFLTKFAEGLQVNTGLEMYKWIMWSLITASPDELRKGISQTILFHRIKAAHPKDTLQQNNVTQALQRVQNVQYKHTLQPLILDYSNEQVSVVDVNFIVYLNTHSQEELLAKIGM